MIKRCVYDLESDGLLYDATVIWCVVVKDLYTKEVFKFPPNRIEEGLALLSTYDLIIGHNICGYDIPLILKLYPHFTYKGARDTLCMSKLFNPERNTGHGLESYGIQFGRYKPEHEDWTQYSEAMLHRCSEDVEINCLVYDHLVERYCKNWNWLNPLLLEQDFSRDQAYQELEGVDLDVDLAYRLIKQIDDEVGPLSETLYERIPDRCKPIGSNLEDGVKPFKKDGNYTSKTQEFVNMFDYDLKIMGPYCRFEYERINLGSSTQVKAFLLSVGWIPTEYNISKTTKEITSPKLTEDSYASIKDGTGQLVARRNILVHRRRTIQNYNDPDNKGILSFLRDDGRVPAQGIVCATNTSRTTHLGAICNLPKAVDSVILGKEMRSLFRVLPPYRMLGADLSGIEARITAHFAWPFDNGDYWNILNSVADIHQFNADLIGCSRTIAKAFLYSISFGARAPKLASIIGCSVEEAGVYIDRFWSGNKGVKDLVDYLEKFYKKNKYIVGLDGRKLHVRQAYKLLNTQIQGSAAILFKKWSTINNPEIKGLGLDCKQIITVHDEIQYRCHENDIEEATRVVLEGAAKAGEHFGLKVPIAAEAKVGMNYSETH